MKRIHGWGIYPCVNSNIILPRTLSHCQELLQNLHHPFIPRGSGRSYGDSALAHTIVDMTAFDYLLDFDPQQGIITCGAGILLDTLLRFIVPLGWFLPVTPGTRYVTMGGAVASDVHGKNHHHVGSFSQYILSMDILLGNGEVITISAHQYSDLFQATCGGMGLTGIILSIRLQLIRISSSNILQKIIACSCLEDLVEHFELFKDSPYSVAWIDCMAKGSALGRGILTLGEHAKDGFLHISPSRAYTIPACMPASFLQPALIRLFNQFYYYKLAHTGHKKTTNLQSFFYPLDTLQHWNRLYGRDGFLQYQFVLPKTAGLEGLKAILTKIASSGMGSFLAVLKLLGQSNLNYLSFPQEGYTLALDFKYSSKVLALLSELDQMVLAYNGRIYLTKDARMSAAVFQQCYPNWQLFEYVRHRYHAAGIFGSYQSQRLGLS